MNNKQNSYKISKYKFLLLSLSILAICSVLGGVLGAKFLDNKGTIENILKKVSLIVAIIEENYPSKTEPATLIEAGINSLLNELDPHSNFLDEKSYKRMKEEQKGSFYGLGITLSKLNGMLTVISPIEGTPAHRAGIRAGDIIIEINGNATKDEPIDVSVAKLRGPFGTEVKITIIREGYKAPLHFVLKREEIPINSIPYYFMINPTTGYIKMKAFTQTTYDELAKTLDQLSQQGMKQLILDLRGNSGGLLEMAVEVADVFLPSGSMITYTKGRIPDSSQEYRCRKNDEWEKLPLVILVDRGTASASEIVSGAIQDHDRGLIIGEQTWGKALVQSVYPLKYGTALSLTTAKYYTPSGRLIQRKYASLYSYFFEINEDKKEPNAPDNSKVYYTDSGRKVYGEGSITPDIIIKSKKNNKLMDDLFRKYAFFNFAKKYEAIEKSSKNSSLEKLDRNFQVDEKIINNFKNFITSEKIEFTDEEFIADLKQISREIEREIRLALWGTEDAYKTYLKEDDLIKESLNHFNDAIALYNRIKKE